ncbi:P-loop NTPase fold protein [Azospirillum sp. SYSU D00513]|uniref:KAP family P-loop NTPase fold protein n=1 Tax=Azospirillum sp. SYSU D00513 TaxID=2812561 RepID=UPI001A96F229|nr:P-loop NTPase fold protein [Azospirillum sp. SYSU D00513]
MIEQANPVDTAAQMPAVDLWADDVLDRRSDADFLESFLIGRAEERRQRGLPRSYVLNIDAAWGHGKSFFLERFATQLRAHGHIVAEVNAWRDDHADDPLLAVMAEIDDAVSPHLGVSEEAKEKWRSILRTSTAIALAAGKGAAKYWVKKIIGDGFELAQAQIESTEKEREDAAETSAEAIDGILDKKLEALLESFKKDKATIEEFKAKLGEFLAISEQGEAQKTIFVLVDEIDRCRPSFAISLLERVKHLFEINNVIFIFATNTSQLRHAICAVYGSGFDSDRYLNRFFDRSYVFEEPPISRFVEYLYAKFEIAQDSLSLPPNTDLTSFTAECFRYYGIGLRDAGQCIDMLRSCITVWKSKVKLEAAVLLPFIVASHAERLRVDYTNVLASLRNIRESHGSPDVKWNVVFPDYIDGMYKGGKSVPAEKVFEDLIGAMLKPIYDLVSNERSTEHARWINYRFSEELAILHNNSFRRGQPLYSIMRDYPALVRSAGRLTP